MTKKHPLFGALFAALFPSVLTFFYFFWFSQNAAASQLSYGIGKVVQFGFPVFWTMWILKEKITPPFKNRTTWWWGILFSAFIALGMWLLLHSPVFSSELLAELSLSIEEKLKGFRVRGIGSYLLLAGFYSVIHSFLEEYYWRWFVYGQLKTMISSRWMANFISSFAFMAHHVIVLAVLLGWSNPLTYLLALGVGIGGVFWAWQYEKSGALLAPWLSHLLVDAGIFWVGYQLVF